jgi:O-antigen ligase
MRQIGLAVTGAGLLVLTVGSLLISFPNSSWTYEVHNAATHFMDGMTDDTLNGRTSLWGTLIADLSLDNVYGYGVGGARYYLRTLNPWFSHSHNSALETIYTAGYIGLAVMIGGFVCSLVACAKRWGSPFERMLGVSLIYILATGMMNPSWYETSSLIALTIACCGPWVLVRREGRPVAMIPQRIVS